MPVTAMSPRVIERIAEGRALKAARLFTVLAHTGADADAVAHFADGDWAMAARAAGTRPPSAQTQRLVVAMLAGSARVAALCVTCGIGDPEGIDGARKPAGHAGRCAR